MPSLMMLYDLPLVLVTIISKSLQSQAGDRRLAFEHQPVGHVQPFYD